MYMKQLTLTEAVVETLQLMGEQICGCGVIVSL